jgi:hypothetical protein
MSSVAMLRSYFNIHTRLKTVPSLQLFFWYLWICANDGISSTNELEAFVESPFDSVFHWLVEDEWQEWHNDKAKLNILSASVYNTKGLTARLTPIGPQVLMVLFFASFSAFPEYLTLGNRSVPRPKSNTIKSRHLHTMYRECRKSHTRDPLKRRPLRHHRSVIINRGYVARHKVVRPARDGILQNLRPLGGQLLCQRISSSLLRRQRRHWVAHGLVPHVRLVALVRDIAAQVQPGDAVGCAYGDWVRDGPEGLANVRGVCDIAMRRGEDGAEARGVGGVADIGVCGVVAPVLGRWLAVCSAIPLPLGHEREYVWCD